MESRCPMPDTSAPAQLEGVTHHTVAVNGTRLHFVSAGTVGSPVLLVHGFPETWWTFHKLIPLVAARHRVFAVDLRGFGDSSNAAGPYDSATMADDLHELVTRLDSGPVHLTGQDISGATVFRLTATHPDDVRSLTAVEMGLAGFGLESFADVTCGGSWHIGVLAAPGIADMLLAGHEREFLADWAFPTMSADAASISYTDIAEFTRTYTRRHAWRGAIGLYQSMLSEGEDIRALAGSGPLTMPILAVGGGGGAFTAQTMAKVAGGEVIAAQIDGAGHYVALEAPEALSTAMLDFYTNIDTTSPNTTS
jgi:pimeloyl-ACP methyl ester carboxylesterase